MRIDQQPRSPGLGDGHSLSQEWCLTQIGSCLIKLQPNAFCSNQFFRVSAFPLKDQGNNLGQWLQVTFLSCLLHRNTVYQLPRYLKLLLQEMLRKSIEISMMNSHVPFTHEQFSTHGQSCYTSASTNFPPPNLWNYFEANPRHTISSGNISIYAFKR